MREYFSYWCKKVLFYEFEGMKGIKDWNLEFFVEMFGWEYREYLLVFEGGCFVFILWENLFFFSSWDVFRMRFLFNFLKRIEWLYWFVCGWWS